MYSWTNSAKIPYMVFQLFAEGFPSQPSPTPNLKEPMNPETLPPSAYRITSHEILALLTFNSGPETYQSRKVLALAELSDDSDLVRAGMGTLNVRDSLQREGEEVTLQGEAEAIAKILASAHTWYRRRSCLPQQLMDISQQPGPYDATTFEQPALGYGRRRIILEGAMLGGLCIAGSGLAWAVSALLLGMSAESGVHMLGLGAVLSGLGWLVTLGGRFTRKVPKPLPDAKDVELNLRLNVMAMWTVLGLVWAACLALWLFAPLGREPDAAVLLPSFMAFPTCLVASVLYMRPIMRRRTTLYTRWLAKTGR